MEFVDGCESRVRFDGASDPSLRDQSPFYSLHWPSLFVSLIFSLVIFVSVFFYFSAEPSKSFLLWLSLSLLIGPFAPPSLTAGDIRVGIGPPLKESPKTDADSIDKPSRKSAKKSMESCFKFDVSSAKSEGTLAKSVENGSKRNSGSVSEDEGKDQTEWTEADDEALRRLMVKHPVGKPGRWEDIARGLDGEFEVGIVIQKAKELGVKKSSDESSYYKFLKQRKAIDNSNNALLTETNHEAENNEKEWSATEDLALLNALKAFPKNTPLRWEKIAASVTGKTKSACMKRVAELKKDFRNAKASSVQVT